MFLRTNLEADLAGLGAGLAGLGAGLAGREGRPCPYMEYGVVYKKVETYCCE